MTIYLSQSVYQVDDSPSMSRMECGYIVKRSRWIVGYSDHYQEGFSVRDDYSLVGLNKITVMPWDGLWRS